MLLLLAGAGSVLASIPQNLTASQARDLIEQDSQVFLLDVRTFPEYQQVRMKDARLIPIDQLLRRIAELPKDRPILVYCAVGSRSSQVVNYLAKNGYGPVYNLNGGIWAWQLRGYPVLKGGP
ncbi:MAG: rhodanese-like domain-containing protein [Desulfuromonas sp.]|nr:MAG: rhodanese-like domain-containing protein [Desulfuromonas sp.]